MHFLGQDAGLDQFAPLFHEIALALLHFAERDSSETSETCSFERIQQ